MTHAPRAERRKQRQAQQRRAIAKAAVAAVMALGAAGISAASLTGSTTGVVARAPNAGSAAPTPGPEAISAEAVRARQNAVVSARDALEQADLAKEAALAESVPADAAQQLDQAINELRAAVAVTQAAQPAVQALQSADDRAPVVTLEAIVAARAPISRPAPNPTSGQATQLPTSDSAVAPPGFVGGGSPEPASMDPAAAMVLADVDRVTTLTIELQVVTTQAQEAAAAVAAARAAEEEAATRKQAQRTSLDEYANGQVPLSVLCELGFASGEQQRCDATEALEQLNAAFRATFSVDLVVTDSYRSYAAQVACRRSKGNLCATPGTSNHGNGIAVDFGGRASSFGTREHDWLLDHAGEFGWALPSWARPSGSKPEPWHWEFVG